MAKIVCVLYDDPIDGYPKTYARDDCPQPRKSTPTDRPCRRQGDRLQARRASRQRRRRARSAQISRIERHQLVVTSSKDGADSVLDNELPTRKSSSRSRSGRPT